MLRKRRRVFIAAPTALCLFAVQATAILILRRFPRTGFPHSRDANDVNRVRQVFVVVGLAVFIASAKMAIDPSDATVSSAQMHDMREIIKSQIKKSMRPTLKLQKKDVKARESDTGEVHSLERQVHSYSAATSMF